MDSEGWILAEAYDPPTRLGVARLVGSDCLTTESTSAASAAAKHRCKPGVAVVFRTRRAVVLGLSAMGFGFSSVSFYVVWFRSHRDDRFPR